MTTKVFNDSLRRQLKEYFLEDTELERGCLITADGEMIPFKNTAKNPVCEIQADLESYDKMVSLLFSGQLYGWAHSHPHWKARPSTTDLRFHQFPVNMIIYSVVDDEFNEFTPDDLKTIAKTMENITVKVIKENSK